MTRSDYGSDEQLKRGTGGVETFWALRSEKVSCPTILPTTAFPSIDSPAISHSRYSRAVSMGILWIID